MCGIDVCNGFKSITKTKYAHRAAKSVNLYQNCTLITIQHNVTFNGDWVNSDDSKKSYKKSERLHFISFLSSSLLAYAALDTRCP